MCAQLEEMLSFLSQVPGPSGQPALQYVVSEWCDKHVSMQVHSVTFIRSFHFQPFFFGMYESRVSTLALCQLLSHCVVTGDQRLTELHVEDSQIHVHSMRGAEDRPHKMTHVQLPVRVLKLLIHDLQSNAKTEEIIDTKVCSSLYIHRKKPVALITSPIPIILILTTNKSPSYSVGYIYVK